MGLYDRDYMKSEEWQRRYGYHKKESNYAKKSVLGSLFVILFLLLVVPISLFLHFNSDNYVKELSTSQNQQSNLFYNRDHEGVKVAQAKKESLPAFDRDTIDPTENNWHNLFVAAKYLKWWKPSDINKAQKVTVEDLYKHTWKYIGKLVRLTIEVQQPEELPPSNTFSKLLNPGGPSTVMLYGIGDIGGIGDAIQYHYGGPFVGFNRGDTVEICGYVIGKVSNTNRLGGACYNIIIAGKYIKKIKK